MENNNNSSNNNNNNQKDIIFSGLSQNDHEDTSNCQHGLAALVSSE